MRRLLFLAAVLLLGSFLWSEAHDNSEYGKYQEYAENPGEETFKAAYEYYTGFSDDTSGMLQMYLHWQELNRLVAAFDSRMDSLASGSRFQYANLLLDMGKYEESIKIYEGLNLASPQWACPYRHKGEAYLKMKEYPQAEEALLKSIEVRKNHYDAYVMLAEAYYEQGKYAEGLKILEEGLPYREENPEYADDAEFEASVQKLYNDLKEMSGKK